MLLACYLKLKFIRQLRLNRCLIPASEMDPVRDKKGKIADDPTLKLMMIGNIGVWMDDGVVIWKKARYSGSPLEWDQLELRRGSEKVGVRPLNKFFQPLNLWVRDDPCNTYGKIWKATIGLRQ